MSIESARLIDHPSVNSLIFDYIFVSILLELVDYVFFFFQAEDGIRDLTVTGVQTCALPISDAGRLGGGPLRRQEDAGGGPARLERHVGRHRPGPVLPDPHRLPAPPRGGQIGRASCRERV